MENRKGNEQTMMPEKLQKKARLNGSIVYISDKYEKAYFPLYHLNQATPLFSSDQEYPGVLLALKQLKTDIGRVTGREPELCLNRIPTKKDMVIAGTLGKNHEIERLVQNKKIKTKDLTGKWETFVIQIIENPLPSVDRALVIVGSDQRGTIYGIYDLCKQIGVSPWYWWADVPVPKKNSLFVLPGNYTLGEPAVKYRGIFINDEAPALSGWVHEKFGGFNHKFYELVFELLLRLKANFLWPAMWPEKAFYDDDPLNPQLANEFGIVIGTSHHEPMMRSHDEWRRYGKGEWNYDKNRDVLKKFWQQGIKRMNSFDSIVTIGMRGDGDLPMTEQANIALLENIIADQRQILTQVTGKDAAAIPQTWALYKEVQDYYDKGMRVPEDVTLLLCDDNWGNIRRVPPLAEKKRPGGYGMYYHFDYVGGPRNYKWLNTSQIARVWEQMHLAFNYGIKNIWIVNVGDIKPMEFPMEFFLDYAWNADKWSVEKVTEYTEKWAGQTFGKKQAKAISQIIAGYTKYNARRKPELLAPDTYSLVNYREAEAVVDQYNQLLKQAENIYQTLAEQSRTAYYQLVLHPVKACANLNRLYFVVAKNHLYAKQGRAVTNKLAREAEELFKQDAEITKYYNEVLTGGKWNHMMDQTYIGYTYWQQPEKNVMPQVKEISIPEKAEMGVAIEGSDKWWPKTKSQAVLPVFDPYQGQNYYLEIFNRGKTTFNYSVQTDYPWLAVTQVKGRVECEERLWVCVNWPKVPLGKHYANITINGPNDASVIVQAIIDNPQYPRPHQVRGFIEGNGCVSMEAPHFTRMVNTETINWHIIPDLGRTLSAITPLPVTAASQLPGANSPHLEYQMYLFTSGEISVRAYFSPTNNFNNTEGLRYAISFDDKSPQIINIHTDNSNQAWQAWEKAVSDNIRTIVSRHHIEESGEHVLKFWMVDPGVVLQKLVVETGEIRPSYLGPPESFYNAVKK